MRERDLPGHLPAEGVQGGGGRREGGGIRIDAGVSEEIAGTSARDIPQDPSTSPDVVLRVGYQMLRTQMSTRAPGR